jgi:hypothetical protein
MADICGMAFTMPGIIVASVIGLKKVPLCELHDERTEVLRKMQDGLPDHSSNELPVCFLLTNLSERVRTLGKREHIGASFADLILISVTLYNRQENK